MNGTESERKDEAQRALEAETHAPRPGEVYRHYKGGVYSVVCTSVDEASYELLVTYHSNLKGTNSTRTLRNFRESVEFCGAAAPRFARVEG